jgi:Cu/Zn superoxide dismutase
MSFVGKSIAIHDGKEIGRQREGASGKALACGVIED